MLNGVNNQTHVKSITWHDLSLAYVGMSSTPVYADVMRKG